MGDANKSAEDLNLPEERMRATVENKPEPRAVLTQQPAQVLPASTFRGHAPEDLRRRFRQHTLNSHQHAACKSIRETLLEAAADICELMPSCPEATRAVNLLEGAMFLANAAVARHGTPHKAANGQAAVR